MTDDLLAAAAHLADVIAAESAALAAFDLRAAAATVTSKQPAAEAFAAAFRSQTAPIEPGRRRQVDAVGRSLRRWHRRTAACWSERSRHRLA